MIRNKFFTLRNKFFTLLFLSFVTLQAQVGVNTETPKATLDVAAGTDDPNGILIPRLTGNKIKTMAVGNDQVSMLVYATSGATNLTDGSEEAQRAKLITHKGFYFWNGTFWEPIKTYDWALNGNTVQEDNFLGTLNDQDLVFKRNNKTSASLKSFNSINYLEVGETGKNMPNSLGFNYPNYTPTQLIFNPIPVTETEHKPLPTLVLARDFSGWKPTARFDIGRTVPKGERGGNAMTDFRLRVSYAGHANDGKDLATALTVNASSFNYARVGVNMQDDLPQEVLDVNGNIQTSQSIIFKEAGINATDNTSCSKPGQIVYKNDAFYGCAGGTWKKLHQ